MKLLLLGSALLCLSITSLTAMELDPFADSPQDPFRFDISASDVTVEQLCELLRQKSEAFVPPEGTKHLPLNIVVAKEAEDLTLPDMKLRQVSITQFASFINQIGERQPKNKQFGISSSHDIYYFWADTESAQKEKLETTVFDLAEDAEEALGLIEEALGLHARVYRPTLKFHEPSQSLIVTANAQDLRLISKVVSLIGSRRNAQLKGQAAKQAQDLKMENEMLLTKLNQFETEKATARDHMKDQISQLMAELEAVKAEYRELQQSTNDAKAEIAPTARRR